MPVEGNDDPFGGNSDLLGRSIENAFVGLVRYEPVDIARLQIIGSDSLLDDLRDRIHREAEHFITLDRHGNTSAASIPLALVTAVRDGRIKAGDLVLFEAMGGGFTWGANLIRW